VSTKILLACCEPEPVWRRRPFLSFFLSSSSFLFGLECDRFWLVESARQSAELEGILLHEIEVCGRVCDVYPKNYMAWTHRLAVVRKLARAGDDAGCGRRQQLLLLELDRTREWAERHVSDHAGLHHLQSVLVLVCGLSRAEPGGFACLT